MCHINDTYYTDNFSDNDYFLKIMRVSNYENVKIVSNFVIGAFNSVFVFIQFRVKISSFESTFSSFESKFHIFKLKFHIIES